MFNQTLSNACSIFLIAFFPLKATPQTGPLVITPAAPVVTQSPLVITHVTVIDMVRPKAKPAMTVIIEGNRIRSITKSGRVHIPKVARVIDGRGKFLIPGLWDMHVHALRAERVDYFLPLLVANGVTGIRDMGTTTEGFAALSELRQKIATGTRLGPRIYAAGRILDGARPAVPENSVPFASPTEAREAVRSLELHGADLRGRQDPRWRQARGAGKFSSLRESY